MNLKSRLMAGLKTRKGVNLIELLIAVALVSVVVMGFISIELFSRRHVISSDRRAKLQNDVSYILEHMTKEVARAIGNENIDGDNAIINTSNIGSDLAVKAFVDYRDAAAQKPGQRDSEDYWLAYRLNGNELRYCPKCVDSTCQVCVPQDWGVNAENTLSKKVTNFVITKPGGATLSEGNIGVEVTECWDPATANPPEGTPDNPCVKMDTRINLPLVSTN